MDETIKWIVSQSAIVAFLIGFIIYREKQFKKDRDFFIEQLKKKDELLKETMDRVMNLYQAAIESETTLINEIKHMRSEIDAWFRK